MVRECIFLRTRSLLLSNSNEFGLASSELTKKREARVYCRKRVLRANLGKGQFFSSL